jgi:GGDEF domain-containing protein
VRSVSTAGDLARPADTVDPGVSCAAVIQRFRDNEYLLALPVLDDERRPLGLLRSMHVLKRGAERYFTDLFGRRSCTELMDTKPWVFDVGTSLRAISETLSNSDDRFLADGYLVTEQGRFIGVGRATDLIKALADQQAHTARHEHPLTGLPGVQTVEPQLQMWAGRQSHFVAVLFGISAFKGFNAEYGHEQGDQLIRFVAALIAKAAAPANGFVSHFNSDDFLLLLPAEGDWERPLKQICSDFDAGVHRFLRMDHVLAGGYAGLDRQHNEVVQVLPSLRGGGRLCEARSPPWPELLAQLRALRQSAKQQGRESRFLLASNRNAQQSR